MMVGHRVVVADRNRPYEGQTKDIVETVNLGEICMHMYAYVCTV
jgi:hypothetical protein